MASLLDHELLDQAVKAAEKMERGESPGVAEVKAVTACWRMWGRIMSSGRDKTFTELVRNRGEMRRRFGDPGAEEL